MALGGRLHGLQLWVAFPTKDEDAPPSFHHHAADEWPPIVHDDAR